MNLPVENRRRGNPTIIQLKLENGATLFNAGSDPMSSALYSWIKENKFTLLTAFIVVFHSLFYCRSSLDPVLTPRMVSWSVLTTALAAGLYFSSLCNVQKIKDRLYQKCIFPALLFYLAASASALINAVNLSEGIFEWLKSFIAVLFFFALCRVWTIEKNGSTTISAVMTLTGLTLSFIGICQYYRLAFQFIPGNYFIYATMAHKNLFASALFLTLPFSLYSTYRFSGGLKITAVVATTMTLFAVIIAESRTVWIAGIISTLVTISVISHARSGFKWMTNRDGKLIKKRLAAVIIGCLSVAAALISNQVYQKSVARSIMNTHQIGLERFPPFTNSIFSLSTLNERYNVWQKTLRMIKSHPFIGVGPGQWKIVFPSYGKIDAKRHHEEGAREIFFQRPHNDYLWVLAETGIFGLACVFFFPGCLAFYAVQLIKKAKDQNDAVFAGLMLSGIIGYMVIAFFSFPKERVAHTIFLSIIASCLVARHHLRFPIKNHPLNDLSRLSFKKPVAMVIALMLMFSCVVTYKRLVADFHVKNALDAKNRKQWNQVISEIDRAETFFYTLDPATIPIHWYRGTAYFLTGNIPLAHRDFQKAYSSHPNQIHVLNNIGTCAALNGQKERASFFFRKALSMSPSFDTAINNLMLLSEH